MLFAPCDGAFWKRSLFWKEGPTGEHNIGSNRYMEDIIGWNNPLRKFFILYIEINNKVDMIKKDKTTELRAIIVAVIIRVGKKKTKQINVINKGSVTRERATATSATQAGVYYLASALGRSHKGRDHTGLLSVTVPGYTSEALP